MDPISAIGLAAALAQLLVVLTQTIQYLNDVQNAPEGPWQDNSTGSRSSRPLDKLRLQGRVRQTTRSMNYQP